ncbi:hypothetical protein YY92_08200 [Campylobacter fetus]|uniref:hypothetical protein n=1 Tax=Campylobacter fetus TaxID=196 RepID=UPI0011CC6D71|nr:hypothetical protein [Campylobacter fetus]EAJ1232630.1 hypothetical protein [Campylobacter fetus]EAK0414691.1 hypothetical protein [Campylobacter fetus]TXF09193.1 hypothetical protein FPD25_03405 [Campylobacter fetus subsp. fetus]
MATLGEQLKTVQEAIEATLSGNVSSYKIGEQEIYRLSLKELQAREDRLTKMIQVYGVDYDLLVSKHIRRARIGFGNG